MFYEDGSNKCASNNYVIDIESNNKPPCESCNSQCITNCFDINENSCTCDFNKGLYFIKTESTYKDFYCHKIDNINFAIYNKFELDNLKST
jgi:hypothetical protein